MNLQQFKDWALAQGEVGNPTADPNNAFKGQCVSLIQQYLNKVYNIAWVPRGDAKDWPTNPSVMNYFERVSSPQAGDIGVMGSNYGSGYGHIFIYTSPTKIIEQNGRVPLHISTGTAYAPIAILRRKGTGEIMVTPDSIMKSFLMAEIPATEKDLQNEAYYKDPNLLVDTLYNNGGQQNLLQPDDIKNFCKAMYHVEDDDSDLALASGSWKAAMYALAAKYPTQPSSVDEETKGLVKRLLDKLNLGGK